MDLEVTLDAAVGEHVEFIFHAVNPGTDSIELTFPTGQVADVTVYSTDGDDRVWQWSEDKAFTQAVEHRTLEPGDAFEQVYLWEDPPPGEYRAVAQLETEPAHETATTLRVS